MPLRAKLRLQKKPKLRLIELVGRSTLAFNNLRLIGGQMHSFLVAAVSCLTFFPPLIEATVYPPRPTISSLTPSSGDGGLTTITGENLLPQGGISYVDIYAYGTTTLLKQISVNADAVNSIAVNLPTAADLNLESGTKVDIKMVAISSTGTPSNISTPSTYTFD